MKHKVDIKDETLILNQNMESAFKLTIVNKLKSIQNRIAIKRSISNQNMENAFKLVIFNKDIFNEIKKYRRGKSYKEDPEHVINVLLEGVTFEKNFKLFKDIFKNVRSYHTESVIRSDRHTIYKELDGRKKDLIDAVLYYAEKIVKYLLLKYDYSYEQECNDENEYNHGKKKPIILKAIQVSIDGMNKSMYRELNKYLNKRSIQLNVRMGNGAIYHGNENMLTTMRYAPKCRCRCVEFNGSLRDFGRYFY